MSVLLLTFSFGSLANTLSGKVVSVSDGDTLWVLSNQVRTKVRLWGVDAPEIGQPWGMKAKQALASKVMHQHVKVNVKGEDQYRRVLGVVFYDGADINAWLVEQGHAWVYTYYNKTHYHAEQKIARDTKRGLWQLVQSERQPPWRWRRNH